MRHHAFAAAIGISTAALLAPGSQSHAASADPTGYWMKPDAEREVQDPGFQVREGKKHLCAKIAWLKDPKDSKGRPLHDVRNEDPSLRGRPIVGLPIFTGLTPSAPSTWTGKIYNPEDGQHLHRDADGRFAQADPAQRLQGLAALRREAMVADAPPPPEESYRPRPRRAQSRSRRRSRRTAPARAAGRRRGRARASRARGAAATRQPTAPRRQEMQATARRKLPADAAQAER